MNPNILKGKTVVGTDGYVLGEFNSLNIDFNSWQANSFNVILSDEAASELNFKKPFLRKIIVGLPTQIIQAVGDVVTLKEPVRNIKDVAEKETHVNPPKIYGKKVVSAKGYDVGEVEGLDVELSDWAVSGLQVGLTDDAATELGFKRPVMSKVVVIVPTNIVYRSRKFRHFR